MTTQPLLSSADLDGFPGAPFDDDLVDVAAASVRGEARWHIAPVVTETITLESYGGTLLLLPTRRVVSINAVRDVTTGSTVLTGWTRTLGGVYRRQGGWPVGVVEVDLTHGYDSIPLDLLPVIVARVQQASNPRDPFTASRTVGQVSETYRDGAAVGVTDPTVARYALVAGVA